MIRQFTYGPKFLQDGHIVYFSPAFDVAKVREYAGKYFMISEPQVVSYDRSYIIPRTNYVDIDLHNSATTESIYPYHGMELSEVLMAYRGQNMLIYPIIPPPDWYMNKLGYTGKIPRITDTDLRYLGCYKEADSYYDEEEPEETVMKIRFMFLPDLVALVLRAYNDSASAHEKLVIHFLINRCSLEELPSPTEEQKRVARQVLYYTELKKGGGQ